MAAIALVDDHSLLRNGLAALVRNLGHTVLFEADNGNDFISMLDTTALPEIVMMDINMPGLNGYETTLWLKQNYPSIMVLALSMYDSETAILLMMKCGARGYILKDSKPAILKDGIESLLKNGHYYSELVNDKIVDALIKTSKESIYIKTLGQLTPKETQFLNLICTGLNYEEIAEKMQLSKRTVEKYRDAMFSKINVNSRLDLAMYAVKNGLVHF